MFLFSGKRYSRNRGQAQEWERGEMAGNSEWIVQAKPNFSFAFHVSLSLSLSLLLNTSVSQSASQSVNKRSLMARHVCNVNMRECLRFLFWFASLFLSPSLSVFYSSHSTHLCVFVFCYCVIIEQREMTHTRTRLSTTTFILSLAFSLSLTFFLFTIFGHPFCTLATLTHTHERTPARIKLVYK